MRKLGRGRGLVRILAYHPRFPGFDSPHVHKFSIFKSVILDKLILEWYIYCDDKLGIHTKWNRKATRMGCFFYIKLFILSPVFIFKSLNIIFAKIRSGLHFDKYHVLVTIIADSMLGADWNFDRITNA